MAGSVGQFRMWVLPIQREGTIYHSGGMHCVPLNVNRVIHYSARSDSGPEITGATIEQSCSTLPRSRPQRGLYRVEIPESRFLAKDKDLAGALTDPLSVDAVFGAKSPLAYEAVLEAGILCAPRRSLTGTGSLSTPKLLGKGVNLDDLTPKDAEGVPYLTSSLNENAELLLNQAFLYGSHAIDASSRALYALIAPAAKLVLVIVVSTSRQAPRVNVGNLWSRLVSGREEEAGKGMEVDGEESADLSSVLPSDVQYDIRGVRSREEAWSELNTALQNLRDGTNSAVEF